MFLTKLIINADGSCEEAIRDIVSSGEMHRTIARSVGGNNLGTLWRMESVRPNQPSATVLIQSVKQPNWTFLDDIPGYSLFVESKKIAYNVVEGSRYIYCLKANPTTYINGKRQGIITEKQQTDWLVNKGMKYGFRVVSVVINASGIDKITRPKRMSHVFCEFSGVLEVTDSELFKKVLERGIGHAKAFGYGMISIARYS